MIGPGDRFAEEGAAVVLKEAPTAPEVAVILGSGLGAAAAGMEVEAEVAYADLPGFPEPTVPGHAGRLLVGRLAGVPTAAFLGRVHFYEGHPMSLVTLPARLAAALGARTLVATAAVGGLDPGLRAGMLVVGADHLSFLGQSPLRGWRDPEGGPVFVDLSRAYDPVLADRAMAAADAERLAAARGVYASMPGPAFETPAEVAFLRGAGATVAGMSVVPEVTAAVALGLRCLGLYCVTNVAGASVGHAEVIGVAEGFAPRLAAVLERVLSEI